MIQKIDLIVSKIQNTAKIVSYVAKVFSHIANSLASIPRLGGNEKE